MGIPEGRRGRRRRAVARFWWSGFLAFLVVAGVVLAWRAQSPPPRVVPTTAGPPSSGIGPSVPRRETRATLDPARFVGKARLAHQVAREIPEVLDQLYCYCGCDRHGGHTSLLSCYTDGHAAT